MYKVLLVDDEVIIREGLKNNIDWKMHDMEVIATAEDGLDALEIVKNKHPDIIITDIKMAFMDGLQLISEVKSISPDTLIIFISGHDEFNYARKAIGLGAFDYVLKPIELDYLAKLLNKAQDKLNRSKKMESELAHLQELYEGSKPILLESVFKDVIFGRRINVKTELEKLNISIGEMVFATAILNIAEFAYIASNMTIEEIIRLDDCMQRIVDEVLEKLDFQINFTWREPCEKVLFLFSENRDLFLNETRNCLATIRERIDEETGMEAITALSGIFDKTEEINRSFQQACDTMNYSAISDRSISSEYDQIKSSFGKMDRIDSLADEEILDAINDGDMNRLKQIVSLISDKTASRGSENIQFMHHTALTVFFSVIYALNRSGYLIDEVLENPVLSYRKIFECDTMASIEETLLDFFQEIVDFLNMKKVGKTGEIISRAQQFIREHYHESALALDNVADYVNISVCYFSTLFRKETGKTFKDYLTSVRINKAKELLSKSDLKTFEICYKVGYENPTYFSTLFKKTEGISPSQYRAKQDI